MPRQGIPVLTEQTEKFIGENPMTLTLTRSTRTEDGAGGWTNTGPTPVPSQTVRIVMQSSGVAVERKNSDGEVVTPDLKMIMLPDADVRVGDTFPYRGMTMEVVWVNEFPYELVAEVTRR